MRTYDAAHRSKHTRVCALKYQVQSPEEAGVLPVYEIDAFKIIKNDSLN